MTVRESADDMLLSDYQFQMRKTDDDDAYDEWSSKWDDIAMPVARAGWSTLILLMNQTQDPVSDFKTLFRGVNNIPYVTRRGRVTWKLHKSNVQGRHSVTILQNRVTVMKGFLTDALGRDPQNMNGMIGKNYCMLLAKGMSGSLLQYLINGDMQAGDSDRFDHKTNVYELGGYNDDVGHTGVGGISTAPALRLIAVTGLASDDETGDSLATRLTLVKEEQSKKGNTTIKTDLARCHVTYLHGSDDPSLSPTIEMIAVNKKHRGKDMLPLLGKLTQLCLKANFLLDCRVNDTSPGHFMIRATKITNSIIEHRYFEDGSCTTVTDKDYLFYHAGFSVRDPKEIMPPLPGSVRAQQGHEAFLYADFTEDKDSDSNKLNWNSVKEAIAHIMKDKSELWKENLGAVACDACGKISKEMLLCSHCRTNHYCDATCQKKDWKPRHKAWCGKTRDQVRAILVEKGRL